MAKFRKGDILVLSGRYYRRKVLKIRTSSNEYELSKPNHFDVPDSKGLFFSEKYTEYTYKLDVIATIKEVRGARNRQE